ncbi:uncharacterized protein LOC143586794 [Bidens hawaiensis]|uniref:uncharacterized protein LOC143586794 n=1 Tax=Bidens hawaiensis TaxID=980011 RepID=UPI00404B2F66
MDEDMRIEEVLVTDNAASYSEKNFDSEYEFDASHYFDFTGDETRAEAEQAESWFRFAHEYPPSPFIVKLNLTKAFKTNHAKAHKTSSKKPEANKKTSSSTMSDGDIDHKAASGEMKIKGVKHQNHIPQDNNNIKAKPKSTVNLSKQPSGSSFMKPTASHLAKQNKECDMHSGGFGRLQKPVVSAVEKLRSPIRIQNQTTKRQKLEIGYLRKTVHELITERYLLFVFVHLGNDFVPAAQLKHRATFLHKVSKKGLQAESSSNSRVQTTIPIKPALATEERAQRHMSQNKSKSLQQPLNKKNLDAPKLPQHKSNEFQVFNKQNSASSPVSEDIVMRESSGNSGKKDKCKSSNNLKSFNNEKVHPIKDGGFKLNSKHNSHQPPTELFKKLSLKHEPETKVTSSSKQPQKTKGLKENVPGSYPQEFWRCVGKQNHRGPDRMITEVQI